MTAAECDTFCSFVSIQSRCFNQAKELLCRSRDNWLKLYKCVDNVQNDISDKYKYNALKLEILIAYIMNEHSDTQSQIDSIVNIIKYHLIKDDDIFNNNLLPLQIISKYSHSLIGTLLLVSS